MSEASRGFIRSMAVIGGAQAINILISLVRTKALALMVGPSGIGLFGIYNSLQTVATGLASLGVASGAINQIAAAKARHEGLGVIRFVLLVSHLVQGVIGMAAVWLLRDPLARSLVGDTRHATEIGLIGVVILLSLTAGAYNALLQGNLRVGDLGKVTVFAAIAHSVLGLCAVWLLGEAGLIWFLLTQPLATLVAARHFVRRAQLERIRVPSSREFMATWQPMLSLGVVFMVASIAATGSLLLARAIIARQLGLGAAGEFSAAWGITITYVGFLLTAMTTDFHPRLAACIDDRPAAWRLVNDQAQIVLAAGGPVLLGLVGLAPWVVTLLYSSRFAAAAEVLQWQTAGTVLKLASWPLAFILAVTARKGAYLGVELLLNSVLLAVLWALLPILGLQASGIAFFVANGVYYVALVILTRQLTGFRCSRLSHALTGLHAVFALGLLALGARSPGIAAIAGLALAGATGVGGLRIILARTGSAGRLAGLLTAGFRALRWPVEPAR